MPEMDGIECLHAIRTQTGGFNQNTPVVVLTANAGSENKALYFREGFDGYLLKPVSGAQLEEELLRLLPKKSYQAIQCRRNRGNDRGTDFRAQEKSAGYDIDGHDIGFAGSSHR